MENYRRCAESVSTGASCDEDRDRKFVGGVGKDMDFPIEHVLLTARKKATRLTKKTKEWRAIYRRRASIERLNGRLKAHRRLNNVTVRGRFKVRVHSWLSIIVCQAHALVTGSRRSVRAVA